MVSASSSCPVMNVNTLHRNQLKVTTILPFLMRSIITESAPLHKRRMTPSAWSLQMTDMRLRVLLNSSTARIVNRRRLPLRSHTMSLGFRVWKKNPKLRAAATSAPSSGLAAYRACKSKHPPLPVPTVPDIGWLRCLR